MIGRRVHKKLEVRRASLVEADELMGGMICEPVLRCLRRKLGSCTVRDRLHLLAGPSPGRPVTGHDQ
jgi:hypothetical protein